QIGLAMHDYKPMQHFNLLPYLEGSFPSATVVLLAPVQDRCRPGSAAGQPLGPVSFTPDGKTLLVQWPQIDPQPEVCDVATTRPLRPLPRSSPPPGRVPSPDGHTIALSAQDRLIWLDRRSGKQRASFRCSTELGLTAGGRLLVFLDDRIIRTAEVATAKERK